MATTTPERRSARLLLSEEVPTREAIVRVLEQAGIDMVFGMPGGNAGAIFNSSRKIPPTCLWRSKMRSSMSPTLERCGGETSQRESRGSQALLSARTNNVPTLRRRLEAVLSALAEIRGLSGWTLLGSQHGLPLSSSDVCRAPAGLCFAGGPPFDRAR